VNLTEKKSDRRAYFNAYYQKNKPKTEEEKAIIREAYREKRKEWNKTSRERLRLKKLMEII
jgi:hypothetical protein